LVLGTVQGMRSTCFSVHLIYQQFAFPRTYRQICCLKLTFCFSFSSETARSALARGISKGNLAESLMAFNTNYRDTGLFGIYTTALVKSVALYCFVLIPLA
jgi:hypothetical protein